MSDRYIGKQDLYSNGFVIKRTDSKWAKNFIESNHGYSYKGIEGDTWPISMDSEEIELQERKYLNDYVYHHIEEIAFDENFVAVCNDFNFLNRYLKACEKAAFKVCVLFCETEKKQPKCEKKIKSNDKYKFIGYDYAYADPDYYSCIFHDIPRVKELSQQKLNENGLFDTLEEVCQFIEIRERLKQINPISKFEIGNFTIYKLWKYIGNFQLE
ncbi:hypothetical protein SAMN05444401_2136 [Clostridium amylolyticum]|uniref:Uncharacterized protein n=1 Tax=Clostridium amylolyticum TaxID=1121298 RepID=A0A1M6GJ50_9CLOT|nr:hypothetical protein [Clostridium amylolyticum]SHJ09952.1 hypothetical protein SAMN05444401_2136 [Clostridium amylolyticum]